MKIRPLQNQVLVKRKEADEQTPGGIFIPSTAREREVQEAEVLAVGPGKIGPKGVARVPPEVQPGQVVILKKYTGKDFEIDGERFAMVDDDEIQGVFE